MATPTSASVGAPITAAGYNQIVADLNDTGWTAVSSYLNSFTAGSVPVSYRVLNGMVIFKGNTYRATAPTSTTTAFVLPSQYWPLQTLIIPISLAAWGASVQIDTAGNVGITSTVARVTDPGFPLGAITYPVA